MFCHVSHKIHCTHMPNQENDISHAENMLERNIRKHSCATNLLTWETILLPGKQITFLKQCANMETYCFIVCPELHFF